MSEYRHVEADVRGAIEYASREHSQEAHWGIVTSAYLAGVRGKADALLSDDAVLRALNAEEPRAATDDLADWGDGSIARMRAALAAALGEDESDE